MCRNEGVDRDLLLEFFLTFSKFEYALKASGVIKQHPPDQEGVFRVEPNWDAFAVSLRGAFNAHATNHLAQPCDYLRGHPPDQQVVRNQMLEWERLTPGNMRVVSV